jgi:hypothetical protein
MGKTKTMRKEAETLPLPLLAEMALRQAAAEAIADHKRSNNSIAVWREGRVTLISPEDIVVPKVPRYKKQ